MSFPPQGIKTSLQFKKGFPGKGFLIGKRRLCRKRECLYRNMSSFNGTRNLLKGNEPLAKEPECQESNWTGRSEIRMTK